MSDPADADDPSERRPDLDGVEVIEVVTTEVDSEGNTVVDDSVLVLDAGGTVVAKDETITFESPSGDIFVSALGDDGEMHIIDPLDDLPQPPPAPAD